MAAKRNGFGAWQFMRWVLLVCCLTSVWQVVQLQNGHGNIKLGSHSLLPHPSGLSGTAWKLKDFTKAWSIYVPAESPFAAGASDISDGSKAAPVFVPQDFDVAALPADQFSFAAKGPLESFAGTDGTDPSEESDDPNAVSEKVGKEEDTGKRGECNDVHPNADSPDMLHVMFACDLSQIEGVQASVASVVANAAAPDDLTVHVMVQTKWIRDFKASFGLEEKCWGTVTVTGVLIRVHSVDGSLIEKSVAKVSSSVRKERGAIDSIENFARFYMHLVIEKAIVVYLDADTIVQADLGQLRKQLLKEGKTVGFVKRESPVLMDKFLKEPKNCKIKYKRWKDIMKMPAYNVGVFAVNLERWKRFEYWKKVEDVVDAHNKCDGKLWVGGSQPPLLLAMMNHPKEEKDDYITFDAAWNGGDLGWKSGMPTDKLRKKFVLHWNGNQKPWFQNGLYRGLWLPYRERFDALMRPYGDPKSEAIQWYVSTECNGEGGRGLNCDQTCAAQGRQCDLLRLQAVTSQGEISIAATAAGYNCESFAVETTDKIWDGPWIQGQGSCGYHQGPVWQGACDVTPVCGYNRFCPCKTVKGTKKGKSKKGDKKDKPNDGKGRRRASTPPPSSAQIAAYKKCPTVKLLDSWSETQDVCTLESTFGCGSDSKNMWTTGQCHGMFSVSGVLTTCGSHPKPDSGQQSKKHSCEAGRMNKPSAPCGLMLLSSFFTTRKDWQREKYAKPSFSKFQKLYRTVFELGLNMTLIYDDLPEDILKTYTCERWRWEKVNLDDFDRKYGVNDVRYFFFERLLARHTEWEYIFVIDAFDVQVRINPCPSLQPGKLYVGSEREKLKGHPWMKARYSKMGGKYNDWYKAKVDANMNIMNCGISGGHRDIMLKVFRKMMEIQSDPNLACRKANQDINVNMAALNYIVYTSYTNKIITGAPVHSMYKRFEVNRKDVWFIHK